MRAAGDERLFRVPYGHGELEFMLQPWFDLDIAGSARPRTPYDIVIVGIGKPNDATLSATLRAAAPATPLVREGGAIVIPAQLDEGAGDPLADDSALALLHHQVVVAASESPEIVRLADLRAAVDVEEALDIAYEHIGRPTRASVLLIPRASIVGGGGPTP